MNSCPSRARFPKPQTSVPGPRGATFSNLISLEALEQAHRDELAYRRVVFSRSFETSDQNEALRGRASRSWLSSSRASMTSVAA